MSKETIAQLLDSVQTQVDTDKNRAYYELWDDAAQPPYADFGPFYYMFPRPVNKDGRIPYIFEVEPALWHRVFGVNLK